MAGEPAQYTDISRSPAVIGKLFPWRIGIVGAGRGGTALLRLLRDLPDVTVVGICDIDPEAPGISAARNLGIAVYFSAEELTDAQAMDWLINVSHTSLARRLLLNQSIANVRVIDGDVSELIWRILVAFDEEITGVEGAASKRSEQTDSVRALVWKVVCETADIVQQAHDRLASIAFRDPLTGLYTRRLLLEFLDKEISNACRHGQFLSLLLLDLDHFKSVNDSFGHDAGDAILQKFSAVMIEEGRAGDLAARYGGEEFAMVLPGSSLADAMVFAERLRSRVMCDVNKPNGQPQTVSIGVTSLGIQDDYNIADHNRHIALLRQRLLQSADAALYSAKGDGRNRVVAAH